MKDSIKLLCLAAIGSGLAGMSVLQASEPTVEQFTLDSARTAAEKGDPQAEFFLGKHYAEGTGVARDYVKAAGYLRQAADQGYAPAQSSLGSCYAQGEGVKQDYTNALEWYRKAATKSEPLAEYCLGYAYANGKGVPKDMKQAVAWWHRSAEHGQVYAQNALGQFYFHGEHPRDTNIDLAKSVTWLRKAADQDYGPAMSSLGYMYQYGVGVKHDWSQALKWNRRAAELGDGNGEDNLGQMYENGDAGLPPDMVEAYKWFWLSQEQGNRAGEHDVIETELHHALTPEQIERAKHMATQFHPQTPAGRSAAPREGKMKSIQ